MEVEDRVVLTTPEGVTIELVLAGLGSRFVASLLDWVIRTLVLLAVTITTGLVGPGEMGGWAVAIGVLFLFIVLFGYDPLFEVLNAGRTPGKQLCGLRVVDADGGPIGLVPSVVRNLLRLVDALPGAYLVGLVAIVVSPRNQRLGDLVAGSLVIRDRLAKPPAPWVADEDEVTGWDVAQVTPEEVATVRRFLERRGELLPAARQRLSADLAARLRPKVAGPDASIGDERFLELLVAVKAARR